MLSSMGLLNRGVGRRAVGKALAARSTIPRTGRREEDVRPLIFLMSV
jgi:hypothetical protein